ncbi:MAG: DUF1456 family protein [Crocinitomicaceae bacterium]
MNNNDVMRRVRYIFDIRDTEIVEYFGAYDKEISRSQIDKWLLKDDHPDQGSLFDKDLAIFLNGFITAKRGQREGELPKPEKTLNNNIILRKLKIALDLKDVDIIEIMDLADMRISKPELNAFFRRPDHKHYRKCLDQFLRSFLQGCQIKYKPNK